MTKTAEDLAELVAYAPISPLRQQGIDPFAFVARKIADAARGFEDEGKGMSDEVGDWTERSIHEFVERVDPLYRVSRFHRMLLDVSERFAKGELKRVITNVPTRYGKSRTTSKICPAYCLRRRPDKHALIATCDADLSVGFSDEVRTLFKRSGGKVSKTQDSKKEWQTLEGGGCFAAGRKGRAVGMGADWLFIDDPCKSDKEAEDPKVQKDIIEWYKGVLYMRLHKEAGIMMTMNRWPGGDFTQWLRDNEAIAPEGWHFVIFDAIKGKRFDAEKNEFVDAEPFEVPEGCTIEPDWRKPGDLLWPEEYDRQDVERKILAGGRWADAVVQQRPSDDAIPNRVVPNFSERNVTSLDWVLPGGAFLACDFNVKPMVGVVGQFIGNDRIHFLCEVEVKDNATTDALALAAIQRMPPGIQRRYAYPDPSGDRRDTRSRTNDHAILRSHGFEIHARDKNPAISSRVNAFNMACGAPGRPQKIWIDREGCPNFIEALWRHRYDPRTKKPRKGKDDGYNYDHWFDGGSYIVELWSPFEMMPEVGFEEMPF